MIKRLMSAVWLFTSFAGTGTLAQTVEPVLRIEAGMHTNTIRAAAVDASNRFLVTGSEDKSIRLWDLTTGNLLKVILPPIDLGHEGKIYAVAFSPDGKTIAAGGWTCWEWEGKASVYLFDRLTGAMTGRISGMPGAIFSLAYSKDGQYLAATSSSGGFRVFRTSDNEVVAQDTEFWSGSSEVAFDNLGHMAVVGDDGYLLLYNVRNFSGTSPEVSPTAKLATVGGTKPHSISFSPDDSKIAVGFDDSRAVDIYTVNHRATASTLAYSFSPDNTGVNNGTLAFVAWSADGSSLFAGGNFQSQVDGTWMGMVRKWTQGGRGPYTDLPAAKHTLTKVLALNDGGVLSASFEPSFSRFDANNKRVFYRPSSIADPRNSEQYFRVSYDGSIVQFSYEVFGQSVATFSVYERMLRPGSAPSSLGNLMLANTTALPISDWDHHPSPKFNDKILELQEGEQSQSLAIAPDRQSFLIGADWSLRLFDKSGNLVWSVQAPNTVWSVNITGNGKVGIAAFADGTVRWYRLWDGKELLALFPHNDKKRWVMWTSSGYYDASIGGEDLIGWHINNGKDQAADFFPSSKFHSTYYRPDVVSKVLETVDEREALRIANEEAGIRRQDVVLKNELPPIVQIIRPLDGSEISTTAVTVAYNYRSPSGEPITAVRAYVDGRPVEAYRGLALRRDQQDDDITVTIPPKDCEISIIAENRFGTSVPSSVRLRWAGKSANEFQVKPKLYVLAVGISNYQDKSISLGLPAKDAKDFASSFKTQQGTLYREVITKVLTDQTATKNDILDGLEWIQRETTSKDVAMIFLAGHGVNDPSGIFYFLPFDADVEKIKRSCLPFSEVKNTVSSIAGKVVVFADACHSGNIMGTRRGGVDITGVVNELASSENGAIVFTSSTGRQYSLEAPEWGNGAFTKALVEGISGKADYNKNGRITAKMLDLYVSERVKDLTKGQQSPTTVIPPNVPDFPLAVLK
jgi:WD40 repeat protein